MQRAEPAGEDWLWTLWLVKIPPRIVTSSESRVLLVVSTMVRHDARCHTHMVVVLVKHVNGPWHRRVTSLRKRRWHTQIPLLLLESFQDLGLGCTVKAIYLSN